MQVRVLGPTELDGSPEGRVAVLSHKQRALLAALTLHRGSGVRAETLIEFLWPAQIPRTASGTLQSYVSTLRRLLEPTRAPRGTASVLVTVDDSYRLVLPDHFFDVTAFDMDVTAVHRLVAQGWGPDTIPSVPAQVTTEQVVGLEGRLSRALSTWRGTPYGELGDAPAAAAERARLEELRLVALEDRALLRMRVEHTRQWYDQTHELGERGLSMRAIARQLDLNFKTVRRYLRADVVETLLAGGVRSSVLDSFKPYLHERMASGQRNATVLLGEITEQGYTGGYSILRRYLRPLRHIEAAMLAALSPLPGRPAVRQVTGWITGLPGHLDPADGERLRAIRARCPELDAAVRHVGGFARMIKDMSGDKDTLTGWMDAVEADLPALRSFTGFAATWTP